MWRAGLPYDLIQGSFDPFAKPLWGLKSEVHEQHQAPAPAQRSRSVGTRAQLSSTLGQVRDEAEACEETTQALHVPLSPNMHAPGPNDVVRSRSADRALAEDGVVFSKGTATTDDSSLDGEWGWMEATMALDQM
jgi:hypothetical protein